MTDSHGCPGSQAMDFRRTEEASDAIAGTIQSQLRQWPIQMHLISPNSPYFRGADVLLSADCVAYAIGGFHPEHLKGRSLAIACPKLDEGHETYVQKIASLIDEAGINTLTVMIMQVPCCSGLARLAIRAAQSATRKVPIKQMVVSLHGEILSEDWVEA